MHNHKRLCRIVYPWRPTSIKHIQLSATGVELHIHEACHYNHANMLTAERHAQSYGHDIHEFLHKLYREVANNEVFMVHFFRALDKLDISTLINPSSRNSLNG